MAKEKNTKRNILYIAPSLSVKGGISAMIKNHLNSNLVMKYHILIVGSHVDGPKFLKLIQAILGFFKTFLYLIYKKIDIVHIHEGNIISFKRKFYYIKLASLFRCKIILHHHGGALVEQYNASSKKWKKRIKRTFEEVDIVICLTESWKKNILKIAPSSNIEVVPNGVELPRHFKRLKNNNFNITFLGLIGENKGIFDLLKVVRRLVKDGIGINLNIGGNGKITLLHREITRLGIDNKVNYLGWISEATKDSLLKKTDTYVLPSYSECLPMSILEAMSYSIPVISTWVGGIPELVSDGETGFLIEPGNLNELYDKLKYLIQDKELRDKFGDKARQVISYRHNIDLIAQKIDSIYNIL